MTSLLTRLRDKAQPAAAALLPGNRFFVRRLALDGPDVQAQVNLALEALSPFPLEQMLVGHLVAADGRAALIRMMRPDDKERLQKAFAQLDPQTLDFLQGALLHALDGVFVALTGVAVAVRWELKLFTVWI